ncbi:tumor necrosis factor receptor superfamily member 9 [Rhinophrynus dorsalis]
MKGIFQYRTVCTSTTDAECVCIQGWKCVGENCERCTRDPCLEGQEPVGNQCVDCPYGTFKPGTDGNCRPWKSCSAEGGKVLSNGTRTSDVVCGGNVAPTTTRSTTVSSPTTEITTLGGPVEKAIGMAPVYIALFFAILFIIASILIAFASCKQWMKKMKNQFKKIPTQIVKTAEEEDGCSYHYPEEEQGDEELTQQP